MLRRISEGGYEGKLTPVDGRHWALTKEDVEAHFTEVNELPFLKSLVAGARRFSHVPAAGKVQTTQPARSPAPELPVCVLGGLSKAWTYAGKTKEAAAASEAIAASLKPSVKDRLAFATQVRL